MFQDQPYPYRSWQEHTQEDKLSTRTQNDVYVRDLLSTEDFMLKENRVNLGPYYQYRKQFADFIPQFPMDYGTPDMWGWQNWVKERRIQSQTPEPKAPPLYTRTPQEVFYRGCSSCRRPRKI